MRHEDVRSGTVGDWPAKARTCPERVLERARDGTRTAINCVLIVLDDPQPQSDAVNACNRLRTSMNPITSSSAFPSFSSPDLHKRSLFGIFSLVLNQSELASPTSKRCG